MAPKFTVLQTTKQDLEPLLDLSDAAFGHSAARRAAYPPHLAHLTPAEELRAWRLERIGKRFDDSQVRNYKVVMRDEDAVDGSTTLVAFASWFVPNYNWKDSKVVGQVPGAQEDPSTPAAAKEGDEYPACADAAVKALFPIATKEMREEVWGEDTNWWYLAALAVHPDWQRKGLGQMLLEPLMDQADSDGLFTYLEATPEGRPLYAKNGFITVAEKTVMEGIESYAAMKRPPKGRQ